MATHLDVNIVSSQPTHFLRGVDLVVQARETFKICSENWPSPTKHRLGSPEDKYYAEIWVDGMDWQNNYWVIEAFDYENPVCRPFIIFEDSEQQDRFNDSVFCELIQASLYGRRDTLWIKKADGLSTIWDYFSRINAMDLFEKSAQGLGLYQVEDASQKRVQFYMNKEYVPKNWR